MEVVTDGAPVYPAVLEELLPVAWQRTEQYANNGVGCDHGRRKSRLRPMRGRKRDHSARWWSVGMVRAEPAAGPLRAWVEEPPRRPVAVAFAELALTL